MTKQSPATQVRPGFSDTYRSADAPGEIEQSIGSRIKAFRRARGMTMAALATNTGLSSGGLSQIESGTIQPSLTTLRRIAAALDEPIFRFFVEPTSEPQVVVRAGERRRVIMPGTKTNYELITPTLRGDLEVMEMRIEPGGVSVDYPIGHLGEECLLVLQGHASVRVGDVNYDLRPGDSATFRAELPHQTANLGRSTLVMLSVVTPPSF